MALWVVRIGKYGEYEKRFLDDGRIYLCWSQLNYDLSTVAEREGLRKLISQYYPEALDRTVANYVGQIWGFVHSIHLRDWIIVPFKSNKTIHVAEVTGPYVHNPPGPEPLYHYREVKWVANDLPRSIFDQDLLSSFNGLSSIFQVRRPDGEDRVRKMGASGWIPTGKSPPCNAPDDNPPTDLEDLEQSARDAIGKHIIQLYKGHGLATLVDAILRAQGYTTFKSPEGPDKGIDILAALGPLGFGRPRICVQVKSTDSRVDSPTLFQLIGSMQDVQADQGLLVSWGGFTASVNKEIPAQFFRVRLWDQNTLIDELLAVYDKLDEDLRAELPLKRIWTLAAQEEA